MEGSSLTWRGAMAGGGELLLVDWRDCWWRGAIAGGPWWRGANAGGLPVEPLSIGGQVGVLSLVVGRLEHPSLFC